MYQVIKVLNNNTILAMCEEQEIIILYKGIGFSKKPDEYFEAPSNAKKYIMQKGSQTSRSNHDIVQSIEPVYLEIASDIIKLAIEQFKEGVDEGILLPLADHIRYAIKRMDENIMPSNPFINDIRLLFPTEYEVATKGRDVIEKAISKTINEDEVGYITLHVHSAITSNPVSDSMEATRIIHDSLEQLQKDLNITIDIQSISYVRLMNHIKFLLLRIHTDEKLHMDISEFTKDKFPFAYEQANRICDALSKALKKQMPASEVGYLAIHLERILSSIK